jgi:hypothetical protein
MNRIVRGWSMGSWKSVFFATLALFAAQREAQAQTLRRPITASQPMLMIHIDTWNTADPQKIIDLVPDDLRPYVVMNISLSINHDETTGEWKTIEYGYETAKSWLRTCAQNRIWAMIQPSSGGFSHFPDYDSNIDYDTTMYARFYRDYPNFIGINYAEQFWGFDDKWSLSWTERVAHWTGLMGITNKYGGYLYVNWCGAYYGAGINPIAMMKRNPAFAAVCKKYPQNFILAEKYTSKYGFLDIESTVLGTWLSGYAGAYGIRYDECGWTGAGGVDETFPVPASAAPLIEHAMLTGQSFMDGPELIWTQSIQSLSNGTTTDGYTTRRWGLFPQFKNITMDIYRKILDGTIRIPTRKEVIDRTKVVVLNDNTSGTDQNKYSSPTSLFEGLYKMDGDGDLLANRTYHKKSGRYPTVPTAYLLADTDANSFKVQVKMSGYASRWSNVAAKVSEFNTLFPQESTGELFVGRHENGWVTYNPFKTGVTASASIPFKYNTCTSMELTYAQYTVGVVKEFADKVTFYLTNYDNTNTALKTDVIKINGATTEPTYSFTDRGSHAASSVTKSWSGGVLTLNVTHNGPLDLTVNCAGTGTGRLTDYTKATLVSPTLPAEYTGELQFEAENFDVKSISSNVTSGIGSGIKNHTGMGFVKFGTNAAATIRDTMTVTKAGTYTLGFKYAVAGGDVGTIDLYVNGTKVATPTFAKTGSESVWKVDSRTVTLKAGANVVMLKANAAAPYGVIFDNAVLSLLAASGTISSSPSAGSAQGRFEIYDAQGRKLGDLVVGADQELAAAVEARYAKPGVYFARNPSEAGSAGRKVVVGSP